MRKRLFDVQLAFFIPLWRRIALVTACFAWSVVEVRLGNPYWALLFVAIGLYCAHQFFIAFDPKPAKQDPKASGPSEPAQTDTDEGGSS